MCAILSWLKCRDSGVGFGMWDAVSISYDWIWFRGSFFFWRRKSVLVSVWEMGALSSFECRLTFFIMQFGIQSWQGRSCSFGTKRCGSEHLEWHGFPCFLYLLAMRFMFVFLSAFWWKIVDPTIWIGDVHLEVVVVCHHAKLSFNHCSHIYPSSEHHRVSCAYNLNHGILLS